MLYLLCGKTASGKTTILKHLIDECDIDTIVTCTTRPQRTGEVDGRDYHFLSYDEFMTKLANDEFFEWTSYQVASGETWYYGSLYKDFEGDNDKIIIVNPEGLKAIKKHCKEKKIKVKAILLECDPTSQLARLKNRGDDSEEISRRMKADERDFSNIDHLIDKYIWTDNRTPEQIVHRLVKMIERRRKIRELQNILIRWYDRVIRHRTEEMA